MKKTSIYLSYLLRHHPEDAKLDMDTKGWVNVEQLITNVNEVGKYTLDRELLEKIVAQDDKGRYRYDEDHTRIRACQGHSVPWVVPQLSYGPPPAVLYHGTTAAAWEKIRKSGAISRMERHAVHLTAEEKQGWKSARRHNISAVLLAVDAGRMAEEGYCFGVSDNNVWCTEEVPVKYILNVLQDD